MRISRDISGLVLQVVRKINAWDFRYHADDRYRLLDMLNVPFSRSVGLLGSRAKSPYGALIQPVERTVVRYSKLHKGFHSIRFHRMNARLRSVNLGRDRSLLKRRSTMTQRGTCTQRKSLKNHS